MNALDKIISYVSPAAGLRRARLRELATRSYGGAAKGRLTDGWYAGSTSADAEISAGGRVLRDRSRDLVRNNPWAAKAVAEWASEVVGEGIRPRCADKTTQQVFDAWAKECDADGQGDFYGLQTLVMREMVEAGEVLVRRRPRRGNDGFSVPLQLQVLEADFLDSNKNGTTLGVTAPNNYLVQGIEFTQIGQRAAYHLFGQHPGNSVLIGGSVLGLASALVSKPVPASEICHVFERQRTQVRGVPWGAPIVRKIRDLDDFEFAEIIRKKMESAYVGAIVSDDDADMGITASSTDKIANGITDVHGNPLEQFEPGVFAFLRGGKDIKFNSPSSVGGYGEYKNASLLEVAAGYRIPFEILTGDLSRVNYSSIRAGLISFRRRVRAAQKQILLVQFLNPVWQWFCDAAYLAGEISSPNVPVTWDTPKWEWVDPYKEALADLIAMRSGSRTLAEICAERGKTMEEVLREIADMNRLVDELGIILDSDPRKVTKTGIMQLATEPGEQQMPQSGGQNG